MIHHMPVRINNVFVDISSASQDFTFIAIEPHPGAPRPRRALRGRRTQDGA